MSGRCIVANWKMHHTREAANSFLADFLPRLKRRPGRTVVICPSFPVIYPVAEYLRKHRPRYKVQVGAQNVFWELQGPFTGEVSLPQLIEVGCVYCIIGHSERRQLFGETDQVVQKKAIATIRAGLIPIVCIGESAMERKTGKTLSVLRTQLKAGLKGMASSAIHQVIIAYEPIWAIGTGIQPTLAEIDDAHQTIRQIAPVNKVLYGGSVNEKNVLKLAKSKQIEGFLVGGASLDPEIFAKIVNI